MVETVNPAASAVTTPTPKREQKKKEETARKEAWSEKKAASNEAFKAWLHSKSQQRSQERQIEEIRAQIITAELLTVDYTDSELAYERWLKKKNQSKILEKKERSRKTLEDRAEMKNVLHNIKTRWNLDYKKSQYLHPNSIRGWDSTPLYADRTF